MPDDAPGHDLAHPPEPPHGSTALAEATTYLLAGVVPQAIAAAGRLETTATRATEDAVRAAQSVPGVIQGGSHLTGLLSLLAGGLIGVDSAPLGQLIDMFPLPLLDNYRFLMFAPGAACLTGVALLLFAHVMGRWKEDRGERVNRFVSALDDPEICFRLVAPAFVNEAEVTRMDLGTGAQGEAVRQDHPVLKAAKLISTDDLSRIIVAKGLQAGLLFESRMVTGGQMRVRYRLAVDGA